MKKLFTHFLTIATFLIASNLHAQMPGGAPNGMNAAMLKLFGKNTAFSSRADVKVIEKSQKESTSLSMKMAYLGGKMRADLDMNQMKSDNFAPETLAQLKQISMDKVTSIIRPDSKKMIIVYPALKSFVEMPMSKEEAAALDKDGKLQKTVLGKETIDGHPCVKNKVVITGEKGNQQELIVWMASDLKELPIKIQTADNGVTMVMQFREIQMAKPDAKQFDAPAGFTKYDNMQKLMMGAMSPK